MICLHVWESTVYKKKKSSMKPFVAPEGVARNLLSCLKWHEVKLETEICRDMELQIKKFSRPFRLEAVTNITKPKFTTKLAVVQLHCG